MFKRIALLTTLAMATLSFHASAYAHPNHNSFVSSYGTPQAKSDAGWQNAQASIPDAQDVFILSNYNRSPDHPLSGVEVKVKYNTFIKTADAACVQCHKAGIGVGSGNKSLNDGTGIRYHLSKNRLQTDDNFGFATPLYFGSGLALKAGQNWHKS